MAGQRKSQRGASRGAQTNRASSNASPSPLRWYSAGMASGLFIAFLAYLAMLPAEEDEEATAAARPAANAPSLPQPSFDFYELLPRPDPDPDPVIDGDDMPGPATTTSRAQYLLQAGSFRDPDDADRRRAELLLLGLEPAVEVSQGDNGRWYRVLLGPFESRSAMARARSLTAQQDIDTLLMRRQPAGA